MAGADDGSPACGQRGLQVFPATDLDQPPQRAAPGAAAASKSITSQEERRNQSRVICCAAAGLTSFPSTSRRLRAISLRFPAWDRKNQSPRQQAMR